MAVGKACDEKTCDFLRKEIYLGHSSKGRWASGTNASIKTTKSIGEAINFTTMAHPKRKISTQRRNKRRTHYKIIAPQLSTCSVTGMKHLPHHAYEKDGKLYYQGKIVMVLKK